jgi:hypothetical protein
MRVPNRVKRNVIFRYNEYDLNMNDLYKQYKDFCHAPPIKQKSAGTIHHFNQFWQKFIIYGSQTLPNRMSICLSALN